LSGFRRHELDPPGIDIPSKLRQHRPRYLCLRECQPFAEPGLWGLLPGTAKVGGTDALWFTAGINAESGGLLGVLRP